MDSGDIGGDIIETAIEKTEDGLLLYQLIRESILVGEIITVTYGIGITKINKSKIMGAVFCSDIERGHQKAQRLFSKVSRGLVFPEHLTEILGNEMA